MTLKELASKIALKEGKKSQANIGDVREIIGILSDLTVSMSADELSEMTRAILKSGKRRAKRKPRSS